MQKKNTHKHWSVAVNQRDLNCESRRSAYAGLAKYKLTKRFSQSITYYNNEAIPVNPKPYTRK